MAGENAVGRQAARAGVQSRLIKTIVVGDVERRCIRCSRRGAVRGQHSGIVTRHRDGCIPAGNCHGEQPADNDSADEVGQPHVRKVASGWQIGRGGGYKAYRHIGCRAGGRQRSITCGNIEPGGSISQRPVEWNCSGVGQGQ